MGSSIRRCRSCRIPLFFKEPTYCVQCQRKDGNASAEVSILKAELARKDKQLSDWAETHDGTVDELNRAKAELAEVRGDMEDILASCPPGLDGDDTTGRIVATYIKGQDARLLEVFKTLGVEDDSQEVTAYEDTFVRAIEAIKQAQASLAQRDEMIRALTVHGWVSMTASDNLSLWRVSHGKFIHTGVRMDFEQPPPWPEACSAALRELEGGE